MRCALLKFLQAFLTVAPLIVLASRHSPEYQEARRTGADAKIVVKATDDEGKMVAGIPVRVLMGMNQRDRAYFLDGITDTNGLFVAEGKTTGNEIEIELNKEGFYRSVRRLCFAEMGAEREVKDGRWQPWGMVVCMPVREIRAPCRLVVHADYHVVPTTNAWMGFDLALNDWVSPYGKGLIADFEALLHWDGKPQYHTEDTSLDLRFQRAFSGFYKYDNMTGCSFGGAYMADPSHGLSSSARISSGAEGGNPWHRGFDNNRSWILRSRCEVDESGRLVSANYSTIKALRVEAGWKGNVKMQIRYFFNPKANDPNLEPRR